MSGDNGRHHGLLGQPLPPFFQSSVVLRLLVLALADTCILCFAAMCCLACASLSNLFLGLVVEPSFVSYQFSDAFRIAL